MNRREVLLTGTAALAGAATLPTLAADAVAAPAAERLRLQLWAASSLRDVYICVNAWQGQRYAGHYVFDGGRVYDDGVFAGAGSAFARRIEAAFCARFPGRGVCGREAHFDPAELQALMAG